jgi:cytoskeletal protein RodZ
METYGKYLKKIREKKNITLDKISKITKIKQDYLKAIDDENIGDIVDYTYAKLTILNYARSVGADPSKALNLFDLYNQSKVKKKSVFLGVHKKKKYEKKILIPKILFQIIGLAIFVGVIFTIGIHLHEQGKLQRSLLSKGPISRPEKSSQLLSEDKSNQEKIQGQEIGERSTNLQIKHFKYKEEAFYKKYVLGDKKSPWYVVTKYIRNEETKNTPKGATGRY